MCRQFLCSVMVVFCPVVMLGLVGSASAFQVVDDFESGSLDDWEIIGGQDTLATGPDPISPGNNCLVITPGTATLRIPWGLSQGDSETLFYRLMYDMEPGGTVTLIFGPSDPVGTGWNNYYCITRLNSYGDSANVPDMDVATGSGYTPVVYADLESWRWYNVLLDIDIANKTYDVYIDNALVYKNATFRSTHSPANLEYILLKTTTWNNNFTDGTVYVDDILIGGVLIDTSHVASNPKPKNGAFSENAWLNLSWTPDDFAVSHDVYLGEDFDTVNEATRNSEEFRSNQTDTNLIVGLPDYIYPDGLEPGTTYYWRVDEVNDADPNSPWKGEVWSFSIPPKTSYNPVPADGDAVSGTTPTLSWAMGLDATIHTLYFGEDYEQVENAIQGGIVRSTPDYYPGQLAGEKVYYWRVDEGFGADAFKGDVWTFTTPGAVGNPQPANGADDESMTTTLSWSSADNAASHQLYLGTDKAAVRSADTSSPEYIGPRTLGNESHDPGLLEANTMYYWRVDEVYGGSPLKGPVWSFMVGGYLVVDDFESYTDDDPNGEAIWQTWIDGYGIADNGAQAGNLVPPYCEQKRVHGGSQSMPLFYVNENGVQNSEAVLPLTTQRDWTKAGVTTLSLWIRGDSANAAEPLYVAVSNTAGASAVVAHDDLNAAQIKRWTQWTIPLQLFADQGINLANVDKLAIGLGNKSGMTSSGGTGTMYIDDIRLEQP